MPQKTPAFKWMGVATVGEEILIFRRDSDAPPGLFQIGLSRDGHKFEIFKEWGEVIKENGTQEKIEGGQVHMSEAVVSLYFLTYSFSRGNEHFLAGAKWAGFSHWQKTGTIAPIQEGESGSIVPDFLYKDKLVAYFGGTSLYLADSYDGESWKVYSKPVWSLPKKDIEEGFKARIGTFYTTYSGILLIYFRYKQGEYSLHTLLLDKKDPKKVLWAPTEPLWKKTGEFGNVEMSPLGVAKMDRRLIAYWQDAEGKIYAVDFPEFDHRGTIKKPKTTFPTLEKLKHNPVLEPVSSNPWESKAVFNAAVVSDRDTIHFIYRAVGDDDISVLGYAASHDGFAIDERQNKPAYLPRKHFEGCYTFWHKRGYYDWPFMSGGGGFGGCEDPRITKIDGKFYMIYVAFDGSTPPRLALTSISEEDFHNKNWDWSDPVLISKPGVIDKSGCILPEKVDDKYIIFHRVFPDIQVDFVDSLDFDGKTFLKSEHRIRTRPTMWDSRKVGLGATPIKTDDGWLMIYNAVDDKDDRHYKLGAMLLDKNDPTHVLYRSNAPILAPTENYENDLLKYGIVYCCGAAVKDDNLLVYYGGSDAVLAGATANLPEFINDLKGTGRPVLKPLRKEVHFNA